MKRAVLAVALMLLMPSLVQAQPRLPIAPRPALNATEDPARKWHFLGPIAFTRWGDDGADLWLVRSDGSRLERLTRNRKDDTQPAWAPRDPNIVFVRTGTAGRSDLYTMNTKRGRPSLFLRDGTAPAWSPDGTRLAFVRTVEGNTDLYTVAADGSDLVRVTTDPGDDTDPAWGPAGTRILFASDRDGDFDIYSMSPDGTGLAPITDDAVDQRDPRGHWTWRDVGYNQGPADDPVWCWQDVGVPAPVPGAAGQCTDPGEHTYAVGTWSPWSWLQTGANGTTHLWAWAPGDDIQLTSGRRSDADPDVRPAARSVVRSLTKAAGDVNVGLLGAKAWVDANGSGAGADESASGLILEAPSLCLVGATEPSVATATACDSGAGTGSTSVFADANRIALARDTGLGFCLWAVYRSFFGDGEWEPLFGLTDEPAYCTGNEARWAVGSAW